MTSKLSALEMTSKLSEVSEILECSLRNSVDLDNGAAAEGRTLRSLTRAETLEATFLEVIDSCAAPPEDVVEALKGLIRLRRLKHHL